METRDLIIQTAFLAFLENGYDRVSLNKIVKNTGLTKGAFYHNFSSKSELLHEVMEKYFFTHLTKTIQLIDGTGDSFREKLVTIYQNVLNVNIPVVGQEGDVNQEAFFNLFRECMNIDDQLMAMAKRQQDRILEVMKSAIEHAINAKEIRSDIDALALAELINVTIRGTMMSGIGFNREETEIALKRNVETLMYMIKV